MRFLVCLDTEGAPGKEGGGHETIFDGGALCRSALTELPVVSLRETDPPKSISI